MTVSSPWDDCTWPSQESGAHEVASPSLSVTLSRMASRHDRSATAVTHVTCAVPVCDPSGPHMPVRRVFLSKAAELFQLKMCNSRPPSCYLSFCPHRSRSPRPFGQRHNFLCTTSRDPEKVTAANSWPTPARAQKSGMTCGPHLWTDPRRVAITSATCRIRSPTATSWSLLSGTLTKAITMEGTGPRAKVNGRGMSSFLIQYRENTRV